MTRFLRSRAPAWIAFGAILVLAAALRLTGIRYGLPLPVLNPDEANIVPRAWRMGHGHLDPGWYDYPSLLMALLAPVQAFFAKPDLEAARYVAVAIGLGGVAATWWLGRRAYGTGAGDRRSSGRRGRDDARRLLADGGHRRAPDARDDLRARARGRAAARVGRSRGRPGRVGQVPRGDRRRSRRRRRVGTVALARPGRAAGRRRLCAHEPLRADPRRPRLGRHLARATARPRRLARVRARSRAPLAYVDRLWERSGRSCSSRSPASSPHCAATSTDLVLLSFAVATGSR